MERLGIVVPYRDRKQHLSTFIPHLATYFTRDKIDSGIPVTLAIVEQQPGQEFNRGLLKNIGYRLIAGEIDYICFHDIDYLPVWADYRCPDQPTMIIWHGMESRPLDPGLSNLRAFNQLEMCFSAVVLMRNAQFEAANGYSNDYWGWGLEDTDMKSRLERAGHKPAHRKGTFQPLDHRHEGFQAGQPSPAHLRNNALFKARWDSPTDSWRNEGLSTASFTIVRQQPIKPPDGTRADIKMQHVLVDFPHRPPA